MTIGEYRIAHQNIHHWLRRKYGPATKCGNPSCKQIGPFQWALKRGQKHAKNIRRYMQLCRTCHKLYDGHVKAEIDVDYQAQQKAPRGTAQNSVAIPRDPNQEKPTVISPRVYKKHRSIIKKAAHKLGVSDAEVVRRALEAFSF